MLDMFFQNGAAWFGVPALVGTGIFVIRLVLMLAGGHHGGDAPDVHAADPHADHADSTGAFKAISFQTIMAFAMGFGWGGLAARHAMHLGFGGSALVGVACGVGMGWLLAILLKGMSDLQTSGNIRIDDAVGREGEVYVTVPTRGEGMGQVKVVVNQRLRVFNAVAEDRGAPYQSRVRVVRANPDNSLTVAPV